MREQLLGEVTQHATSFYALIDTKMQDKLHHDDMAGALALAQGELREVFEQHRDAVNRLVETAGKYSLEAEAHAATSLQNGWWWLTFAAGVSLGVVVFFFMMFEIWFKVPLPKGPIEAAIGFN